MLKPSTNGGSGGGSVQNGDAAGRRHTPAAQYVPTPLSSFTVVVSVVTAEHLQAPVGGSYLNAAAANASIFGTAPVIPLASSLNSIHNNHSFDVACGKSFDNVLLLRHRIQSAQAGRDESSGGGDLKGCSPAEMAVPSSRDSYRVHLLLPHEAALGGGKPMQVSQATLRWTQFLQLASFVASVAPRFVPPALPPGIIFAVADTASYVRNSSHLSFVAADFTANMSPNSGSIGVPSPVPEPSAVAEPEVGEFVDGAERERRCTYMTAYLNAALRDGSVSGLKELHAAVGYDLFMQNERLKFSISHTAAAAATAVGPPAMREGRKKRRNATAEVAPVQLTHDHANPSSLSYSLHSHASASTSLELGTVGGDDGAAAVSVSLPTTATLSPPLLATAVPTVMESSSQRTSFHHHHHHHHRRRDGAVKSRTPDEVSLGADVTLMIEECFRLIDTAGAGRITWGSVGGFLLCATPGHFARLMRYVHLHRSAGETSASAVSMVASACADPELAIPGWVTRIAPVYSRPSETLDKAGFVAMTERVLQAAERRRLQRAAGAEDDGEETIVVTTWINRFWLFQYSCIFAALMELVSGPTAAPLRARLLALHVDTAYPHNTEARSGWDGKVLVEVAAAIAETPQLHGFNTLELLCFTYAVSESGLRIVSPEEVLGWVFLGHFATSASFSLEELSSLLDSLSKSMSFSEVLRCLYSPPMWPPKDPSGTAGNVPGETLWRCVATNSRILGVVARAVTLADPAVCAELEGRVRAHQRRVDARHCTSCDSYSARLLEKETELEESLAAQRTAQAEVELHKNARWEAEERLLELLDKESQRKRRQTAHASAGQRRQDADHHHRPTLVMQKEATSGRTSELRPQFEVGYAPMSTGEGISETSTRIVTAGALTYTVPPHRARHVQGLSLDLFLCHTAPTRGHRERVVLRDRSGRRVLTLLIEGNDLRVLGAQIAKIPSPVHYAHERQDSLLHPVSAHQLGGGWRYGDTPRELLMEPHHRSGAALSSTPPTTTPCVAGSFTLQPRTWFRLRSSFDWAEQRASVAVQMVSPPVRAATATGPEEGAGQEGSSQAVGLRMLDAGLVDGVASVSIYPRTELLVSYCNVMVTE